MTTETLWELVADGIRDRILSGEYEVGKRIPSTKQLEKQYGVSQSAVRQGVGELKGAGVLRGQPGKGVYVKAMPDEAADEARDLKALSETVAELKRRTEGYAELREIVSRIESNLIELYGKTGNTYPEDEAVPQWRPDRTVRHG